VLKWDNTGFDWECADDSGSGGVSYWTEGSGAIYPINETVDLLIGATATASAEFAFINLDSGTPELSFANDTLLDLSSIDLTDSAPQGLRLPQGSADPTDPSGSEEGMMYWETDDDQLMVYDGAKWQADRTTATLIVAASDSQNSEKADYVANGTDDDVTIESAITALPAGGGVVALLDGTYSIGDAAGDGIDITKSNVTLIGTGRSTILQRQGDTASNDGVITIGNGSATTVTGVVISDLAIDGCKAIAGNCSTAYEGTENMGIYFNQDVLQSKVLNNFIYDNDGSSIIMWGVTDNNFENIIQGNDIRDGDDRGIDVTHGPNTIVSENTITGHDGGHGIRANLSEGTVITGNILVGNGMNTNPQIFIGYNYVTVTGNSIKDSGTANAAGIDATGSNHTISGNNIEGNGGIGIYITGTYSSVTGNYIAGNAQHGIASNGGDYNVFAGNSIYNNTGSGTNDGIELSSSSDNNLISSNIIGDTDGSGYAIDISSDSDNNYLVGNTYSGIGATNIRDLASNTIYGGQLADSGADYIINPPSNVGIGDLTPEGYVDIDGAVIGQALVQLNESGNQDIIAASASGTTVFNLTRTGDIQADGVFSFGDASPDGAAYNEIGTGNASHTAGGEIENALDLYITDDLEVDGTIFADGGIVDSSGNPIAAYWTRTVGNLYPSTANDTLSATSSASTVATFTSSGSNDALIAGSTSNYFTVTSAGYAQLVDGAVGTPALTFVNDPDTGLYSIGADTLGFTIGGTGELGLSASMLYPVSAGGLDLGGSSNEFNALYLGDDSPAYFGEGQDWSLDFDSSAQRLDLVSALDQGILISTAETTGTALDIQFDSLTTGTGLSLSLDALTTGTGLSVTSTSTALTSGNLADFDWSPSSWATASGDLVKINLGQYGDVTGNLFAIYDNGSDIFKASTAQIESAVPHAFTAAGDVTIAYDLMFSNQTASYIKSKAPFTIQVGESFESNDLTLQTYNSGDIVIDNVDNGTIATFKGADGTVGIGTTSPISRLHLATNTTSLLGKSVLIIDQLETQDVFTASASGTTRLSLTNSGELLIADGSATTPAFSFISDTNTGIYRTSANSMGFSTGGTMRFAINDSYLLGSNDGSPALSSDGGTQPSYAFRGDYDTGLGRPADNELGLYVGNTQALRIDSSGLVGIGNLTPSGLLDVDGAVTGQTLVQLNETGDQAIFTASGSGTTRFTLDRDGSITQTSGDTTTIAYSLLADSLTTGTAFDLSLDALTTGIGLNISSTSTALTTGNLGVFDWSPSSWATASGDLVKINLGQYGDVTGNLFAIYDNGSDIFKASTAQIESAVPHAFTAAGDVTMAYDLEFTNQTASTIKSSAPLTIEAGESFESNNLTLKTYNSGDIVFDNDGTAFAIFTDSGQLGLGDTTPDALFEVTGAVTGKALAILNANGGDQNIFVASSSGTAKVVIDNLGQVGIGTTNPLWDLHVSGSSTSTSSAMIENTADVGTNDVVALNIRIGGDSDDPAYADRWINFMRGDSLVMGKIRGNGDGTVQYDSNGTDFAEYMRKANPSENLPKGTLLCQNGSGITRCSSSENRIVGAVSTSPAFVGGTQYENDPAYVLVGLIGQVKIDVTSENGPVYKGDPITTSLVNPGFGTKATEATRIVGYALDDAPSGGQILTYVNPGWHEPDISLLASGELNISETETGYEVTDSEGNLIDEISGFSEIVAGNIKAGSLTAKDFIVEGTAQISGNIQAGTVETQSVVTDLLTSAQASIDNLLVTVGISTPSLETEVISPIAGTNIVIDLDNTPEGQTESQFGKLLMKGVDGETVAEFDSAGNATFSGELASASLRVEQNASIAGELRAGRILADEIVGLDAKIANAKIDNPSGITLEEIEALLNEAESDQALLNQASGWEVTTATGSASLNEVSVENLFVTDTAAIDTLSVSETVVIGSDLVIQSVFDENQILLASSLNTLTAPLEIQSAATQPLSIMAGLVTIDTSGNVNIAGDLQVAGQIQAKGLVLSNEDTQAESGFGKLLTLLDESGESVAEIDASGSAKFAALETEKLTIESEDTEPILTVDGVIYRTSAFAGRAIVPAHEEHVKIENVNISKDSLIYITPTSSTGLRTLFIKEQEGCEEDTTGLCIPYFMVGFDRAQRSDIGFNWWIIDVTKQASAQNSP